jgi:hypothetical protein
MLENFLAEEFALNKSNGCKPPNQSLSGVAKATYAAEGI